jgi:hypothetical protein
MPATYAYKNGNVITIILYCQKTLIKIKIVLRVRKGNDGEEREHT